MNFLISLDGKLRIYGELFGMRRKRRIGNFRFGVSSSFLRGKAPFRPTVLMIFFWPGLLYFLIRR